MADACWHTRCTHHDSDQQHAAIKRGPLVNQACGRKSVGVYISPSAPNFLAILAGKKNGGDDRRPFRPPCVPNVSFFPNYAAQFTDLTRLSYVIRWFG